MADEALIWIHLLQLGGAVFEPLEQGSVDEVQRLDEVDDGASLRLGAEIHAVHDGPHDGDAAATR